MLVTALWSCTWGRGREGAMAPPPLSTGLHHSLRYPQSNWAPLVLAPEWVGLRTPYAPVGLSNDLSCEAGSLSCCRPNPHGRFQSEVWGFISPCWSPGLWEYGAAGCYPMLCLPRCPPLLSPALSVYLCANVGLQGLLVVRLPALFVPHSASLGPATASRVLSAPPAHLCPSTGVDECLFFIYLVSDFLAVQFSVSSGCGRRRSVSSYASILVLSSLPLLVCQELTRRLAHVNSLNLLGGTWVNYSYGRPVGIRLLVRGDIHKRVWSPDLLDFNAVGLFSGNIYIFILWNIRLSEFWSDSLSFKYKVTEFSG